MITFFVRFVGGVEGTRTLYLSLAKGTLSQMSYNPMLIKVGFHTRHLRHPSIQIRRRLPNSYSRVSSQGTDCAYRQLWLLISAP